MKLLGCFALIAVIPAWAQVSPTINDLPSREFGHAKLTNPATTATANLVEGRELSAPLFVAFAPGGSPMYVADTNNNRVLAWLNPTGLTKGNPADKVIGQRDVYSTFAQGPGPNTDLTSGLGAPTSLAVDGNGNLYVLDAGNNRVVRYPNPFNQTGDLQIDLVIGQKTQSSGRLPNEGNPTPSSKTLSFNAGNGTLRGALALDAQGNLWVTDAGNNRVLRFPTNQLSAGTVEPVADRKLGQANFTSNAITCNNNCQINGTVLLQPQSLAFDSNGTLYVADGYARLASYSDPQSESPATRFFGVVPAPAAGQQPKPFPNDYSLGNSTINAQLAVFTNGNAVFVADTLANRVVYYATPGGYIPSDTAPSPKIDGVVGQPDLFSGESNRVKFHEPDATSLSFPAAGVFDPVTKNLWVVDSGNNRLLSYPASGTFSYTSATVVVGQTDFPFNSPNLIEGKEVWIFNGGFPGGGIAVDESSNPPHLYIADTFNNRVLGFNDARAVGTDPRSLLTQKADLVIGQPDLSRAIANYPGGDPDLPTRTGLFRPVGLVADENGNLWVADAGNGRVLRFPPPFNVAQGTIQTAELVLGQSSFTQKDQSASRQHMSSPHGVALFPSGDLAVSDPTFNRVLVFKKPFSDQNAFSVIGQQDYNSKGAAGTAAGLNTPRHIATDSSGRLYVADSGNNRISVYTNTAAISQTGPTDLVSSNTFFNFNAPQGIAVSAFSGEMWVGSGTAVYHLDEFSRYQQTGAVLQSIASNTPTAVALDASDNLIVAEVINRIAFFFAKLVVKNAFTYTSTRPLTPGMWVQAYAPNGKSFAATDQSHDPPYPTTMAGLELRVNGVPSAIYAVGKTYINFNVPWSAPTSGTAEFLMINSATREILAAGTLAMSNADPAFKTVNGLGTGQILAANLTAQGASKGLNSPTNPIAQGEILQLALTGQGPVNNPPADGFPPSGLVLANPDLQLIIGGKVVPAGNIQFSGLDPSYPGSWIINVRIPDLTQNGPPPCNAVSIILTMHDVSSNYGYDPTNFNNDVSLQSGSATCPAGSGNGRITTFAVK